MLPAVDSDPKVRGSSPFVREQICYLSEDMKPYSCPDMSPAPSWARHTVQPAGTVTPVGMRMLPEPRPFVAIKAYPKATGKLRSSFSFFAKIDSPTFVDGAPFWMTSKWIAVITNTFPGGITNGACVPSNARCWNGLPKSPGHVNR